MSYRNTSPIQQFDPTSCWAASLEWWARAIKRGRPVIDQLNLLNVYVDYWDSSNPDTNPNYGTVSRANLLRILRDPRWRMDTHTMRGRDFDGYVVNRHMRHGPAIVGYFDGSVGGNHVVVAYGATAEHIAVMDPNGARFRGRRVSYFQSSEVIVGAPR